MAPFLLRFAGLALLFALIDFAIVQAVTGGGANPAGLIQASLGRGLANAIIGSILALAPAGLERWRRGHWPGPNWFGIVALVAGGLIMAASYAPLIAGGAGG